MSIMLNKPLAFHITDVGCTGLIVSPYLSGFLRAEPNINDRGLLILFKEFKHDKCRQMLTLSKISYELHNSQSRII